MIETTGRDEDTNEELGTPRARVSVAFPRTLVNRDQMGETGETRETFFSLKNDQRERRYSSLRWGQRKIPLSPEKNHTLGEKSGERETAEAFSAEILSISRGPDRVCSGRLMGSENTTPDSFVKVYRRVRIASTPKPSTFSRASSVTNSFRSVCRLWLAPSQLRLLPVTDSAREFCAGNFKRRLASPVVCLASLSWRLQKEIQEKCAL